MIHFSLFLDMLFATIKISMAKIEFKSVQDLFGYDFLIPSYQRGYRWRESNVELLLSDFEAFADSTDVKYCLQPITVSTVSENIFRVVDGQQRLTTIFLILSYISFPSLYSISYESDDTEHVNPSEIPHINYNSEESYRDIDTYYMVNAYRYISEWFNEHSESKEKIKTLFSSKGIKRVDFIWYELNHESENDVFLRLNAGKIPLTDAELLRASLIFAEEDKARKLQMASEWDDIERRLHNSDFWSFFNKDGVSPFTIRIGCLFDMIKRSDSSVHKNDHVSLPVFFYFYEKLRNGDSAENIWRELKMYYLRLCDWYDDPVSYNLIGASIYFGMDIIKLVSGSMKTNRRKFMKDLEEKLIDMCSEYSTHADDFYDSYNASEKKRVLLLFNILSMNRQKPVNRFPFELFYDKDSGFDVEHINPQNARDITGSDRKRWLLAVLFYYTGTDDKNEQKAWIESHDDEIPHETYAILYSVKPDDVRFRNLYDKIRNTLGYNESSRKSDIGNLCLLDSGTNRSYKDAFFPVKRARIISRLKKGGFVMPCTLNAFLKMYSSNTTALEWTDDDIASMHAEMERVLKW